MSRQLTLYWSDVYKVRNVFGCWIEPLWKKKCGAPYVHLVFGARQTGKSTLLRKLLPRRSLLHHPYPLLLVEQA